MTDRLSDRLAAARERGFVGRRKETATFTSLLEHGSGAVLFVYGPGGIGKTTLLHHFAHLAAQEGRDTVFLDAHEPGLLLPGSAPDSHTLPHTAPGSVLLLDPADGLAEHVLREELPGLLHADTVAVLAARKAPPPAWRADPAWHGLLHSLRLGPLDTTDSLRLLRLRGVQATAEDRSRTLAFARGHPLALALTADVQAQGGSGPLSSAESPHIVQALLDCLLETVPSPLHRTALEASAQVLVTTEPLLAALLEVPDARPVFDWLRSLSAVEYGARGIRPHDLVRDALDADLRWRHPDRRTALRRRAGAYYHRLFDGTDRTRQRAVLADFAYLHRESPVVGPMLSPVTGGEMEHLRVTAAGPGELPELSALAERHEGAESARLLRAWTSRRPEPARPAAGPECAHPEFEPYTVRGPGPGAAPLGFYALLWLGSTPEAPHPTEPPGAPKSPPPQGDPALDDPAVRAARRWLAGPGGLREGEQALLVRFWMARDTYQDVSPVQMLITLRLTHHYLTGRRPALTLLPFADPEFWAAGCAYVDFARLPEADFTVAGIRYGIFVHDWRRTPGPDWLHLLTLREASDDPLSVPAPQTVPTAPVLDHAEFGAAARTALRALGRADGLWDSALLGTRMVMSRCGSDAGQRERAAVLRELIRTAAARLEESAADRRAFRALHHTYFQPAGTQQRAADLLGLPMTTYRRHLAAGVERLTALLWREELETKREPEPE